MCKAKLECNKREKSAIVIDHEKNLCMHDVTIYTCAAHAQRAQSNRT